MLLTDLVRILISKNTVLNFLYKHTLLHKILFILLKYKLSTGHHHKHLSNTTTVAFYGKFSNLHSPNTTDFWLDNTSNDRTELISSDENESTI